VLIEFASAVEVLGTVPLALGMTYNDKMRGLGRVGQALRHALNREGLLGLPAAPIRSYIRTRVGLEALVAAISRIPLLVGENFQLAKTSGITAIINIYARRAPAAFMSRRAGRTRRRRSASAS
jgi:hypothetical protein